jgi:hypothetical protein
MTSRATRLAGKDKMLKKILRKAMVIFLCQALAYSPLVNAAQLSLPSGDLIAPEITQDKYIDKVKKGADHPITVTVTDNVGVKLVTLYYKTIGSEEYKRRTMDNITNTDEYHVTINSDEIIPPGVEYYIQAMDNAGNTVLHGYSFSPLSVKTTNGDAATVASGNTAAVLASAEEESSNTWLWIGLGALAVVLVAAAAGGGGDSGGDTPPTTATLNINASDPTQ